MIALALTLLSLAAAPAAAPQNVLRNPSFELLDPKGQPQDWTTSGDRKLVEQSLAADSGRQGGRSARLRCDRFAAGSQSAHAMLVQQGVKLAKAKTCRLSLWLKAERIADGIVSLALSDTKDWENCGLHEQAIVGDAWSRHVFVFQTTRECGEATRLQLWFASTGTLWVDDLLLEEDVADPYRPTAVHPAAGVVNLVPNASFECGPDSWGSTEPQPTWQWGGALNALFGRIDTTTAAHGQASLRVELTPENRPVQFFDYYELQRKPVLAPMAANIGYLEVTPGASYTISAYVKAAKSDTPARLGVREFLGRSVYRPIVAGTKWQRQSFTFRPKARWCFVIVGPDLEASRDVPHPPERATLWIDGVQLEAGVAATAFRPRRPLELGVWTESAGNVFHWDQPVTVRLAAYNAGAPVKTAVALQATDFFDAPVWQETVALELARDGRLERQLSIPPGDARRGYMQLTAAAEPTAADAAPRLLRLASIPAFAGGDSRFGVNHAYPWPHLLDLCRKAGLLWVRDWSLAWHHVEAEKGKFSFAETDLQIDRPRRHGLEVLGLLPFPSNAWSSSAGDEVPKTTRYPQSRERAAWAPRDLKEFEAYVAKTVTHYRGRLTWYQVFNEPLYTSYSLPRAKGYDGRTYATLARAFIAAARKADPQCRILAGLGGLHEGRLMDEWEQVLSSGLAGHDALDLHNYPGPRRPEYIEPLLERLAAMMDKHGGRKPLWMTECGYYADDQPATEPPMHSGFDRPLASERLQTAYAVRWATLCFANGVEKLFWHAGTCDPLGGDSYQGVFYEYGGEPHRIYAAQAMMSKLFAPTCRPVKRLDWKEPARGYLFQDGKRLLAVAWATEGRAKRPLALGKGLAASDLMGRPITARSVYLEETPIYIEARDLSVADFERRLAGKKGAAEE